MRDDEEPKAVTRKAQISTDYRCCSLQAYNPSPEPWLRLPRAWKPYGKVQAPSWAVTTPWKSPGSAGLGQSPVAEGYLGGCASSHKRHGVMGEWCSVGSWMGAAWWVPACLHASNPTMRVFRSSAAEEHAGDDSHGRWRTSATETTPAYYGPTRLSGLFVPLQPTTNSFL